MIASVDTFHAGPDVVQQVKVSQTTYLGHATMLIELDGIRILTDPLLRNRTAHLRRSSRICDRGHELEDLDAVLISHMHLDHLDIPSLRTLPSRTRVYSPTGSAPLLRRAGLTNVVEVRPGDRKFIDDVVIEVTPANHDGGRPPFGPSGEAVGFVIQGSSSIYFAGDTDLFDEMASLAPALDLALLPIWGWGPSLGEGHLDPERAAEALTLLKPSVVIPIHWGTLCPIGLNWTRPKFLTEPPRAFVRAAYKAAPEVIVRVLDPGGRMELPRLAI